MSSRWSIRHIDINNAFLNGDLQECVFMQQPPGFNTTASHLVYQLNKAIYGLKQTPRSWFLKLSTTLLHIGFKPTKSDTSLFVKYTPTSSLFVLVYVDDILITGSFDIEIPSLIFNIHSFFPLKDLGPLHHFFGIQITRTASGNMHLSQSQYNLLQCTNMLASKPYPTPMVSNTRLHQNSSEIFSDPTLYRSIVGTLQYLLVTRPELS